VSAASAWWSPAREIAGRSGQRWNLTPERGIVGGISTGANLCAAYRVASRDEFAGKRVVTIACSFGERYLSTPLFEQRSS